MTFIPYEWPPSSRKVVGGEWIRYRTRLSIPDAQKLGGPHNCSDAFNPSVINRMLGVGSTRSENSARRDLQEIFYSRACELFDALNLGTHCIAELALPPRGSDECSDPVSTLALIAMSRRHHITLRKALYWEGILKPFYRKGSTYPIVNYWEWNILVWKGNGQ